MWHLSTLYDEGPTLTPFGYTGRERGRGATEGTTLRHWCRTFGGLKGLVGYLPSTRSPTRSWVVQKQKHQVSVSLKFYRNKDVVSNRIRLFVWFVEWVQVSRSITVSILILGLGDWLLSSRYEVVSGFSVLSEVVWLRIRFLGLSTFAFVCFTPDHFSVMGTELQVLILPLPVLPFFGVTSWKLSPDPSGSPVSTL